MSVDKFGRHKKTQDALRGPPGQGFPLSTDGQYDAEHRRVVNISDPLGDNDAMIKKNCIHLTSDKKAFECHNKRIARVHAPTHYADAANVDWVLDNCLSIVNGKTINAHQLRIENVKDPAKDNDASNKKYVDENINKQHKDVKAELSTYIKDNSIILEKDVYNTRNRRVVNLSDPKDPADCCTKKYVDSEIKASKHELSEELLQQTKKFKQHIEIIEKVIDKFDNEIQMLYIGAIRPQHPLVVVEKKARDMFTSN